MSAINSYLTFNGNCREAMNFYKKCLGGKLILQTIADSPMADKIPAAMKKHVLQAVLHRDKLLLMGSDMVGEKGLIKGNAVSLVLHCRSEKEIRVLYKRLAEGGEPTHPPAPGYWGILSGDLTDKYGHHWLLRVDKNSKK